MVKTINLGNIDTVIGRCPHCNNETLLISLVRDFYKCTICEEDIQQYVNGHIKYIIPNLENKKILDQFKEDG
tara:strand:- start:112 stop:327 length:216 start_codon:yes stop_codon:yes gene_type:complete